MVIGILRFSLQLPENDSLKGKRKVALSLKQKLRNKFNLAVSEVAGHDNLHRLDIAAVTVSPDSQRVESILHKALSLVEAAAEGPVVDVATEILHE